MFYTCICRLIYTKVKLSWSRVYDVVSELIIRMKVTPLPHFQNHVFHCNFGNYPDTAN